MFAPERGRLAMIDTAVALDAEGRDLRLSPQDLAGTDEVMLAAKTVRHAVRDGDETGLCREIAARTADRGDVAAIEVRTEVYDVVAWYDGRHEPRSVTVRAHCDAP
jgi:hypothetical protein